MSDGRVRGFAAMDRDKQAPTPTNVQAFFIWKKVWEAQLGEDFDEPTQQTVHKWLKEFQTKTVFEWHEFFYDHCEEYVAQFEENLELV